jgi:hypothetical protein
MEIYKIKMNIFEKFPNLRGQGIVNFLRYRYDSMEEAYLIELNETPKKCKYCSDTAKFASIFLGYKTTCNKKECKHKLTVDANRLESQKRMNNKGFVYVKCGVCNINLIRVRNVKYETYPVHICGKEYCKRNKDRQFLRETHIIENFDPYNTSYLNILTFKLMSEYKNETRVRRILYKNLLIKGIEDVQTTLNKCPTLGWFFRKDFSEEDFILLRDGKFYIPKNYKYKNSFIKKMYKDKLFEFVKKYYPENIRKCMICGKEFIYKKIFSDYNSSEITCSLKCYYKNFKYYMTKERRKKHSNTMKRKILNGEFTPNVFNSNTSKTIELSTKNEILKFRSSWEIIFYVMYDNPSELLYEKLRLEYMTEKGKRIYIVDFMNQTKKIIYEIKPSCHFKNNISILKKTILEKWCNENDYDYAYIDEFYLRKFSFINFMENLRNKEFNIDESLKEKIKRFLEYVEIN